MKQSRSKKSQHVRQVFAQAARKIILNEGPEGFSVRKAADEAGYTFATLYNHFNSADELLWCARSLMIDDLIEYMEKNAPGAPPSPDTLKRLLQAYLRYFIERPTVYRFFYFHSLDPSEKKDPDSTSNESFGNRFAEALAFINHEEKLPMLMQQIIFALQGGLTLYIGGNDGLTPENLYQFAAQLASTITCDQELS